MSAEVKKEIQLEIGHVLFIDIVSYSKLLITEQSEQIQKLKQIVRGMEQFRLAEAEGKLLRLPTGDGGALVFRTSPEAPVRCAIEISRELKRHPELRVRMGIHSGTVNAISDLNEQANIAGAGINIAQRVMDCGDAGHILLSQHVADDLEQYPRVAFALTRSWRMRSEARCPRAHGKLLHRRVGQSRRAGKIQARRCRGGCCGRKETTGQSKVPRRRRCNHRCDCAQLSNLSNISTPQRSLPTSSGKIDCGAPV